MELIYSGRARPFEGSSHATERTSAIRPGAVDRVSFDRRSAEIVEWIGGQFLGKDTAKAFVAAQNDPWDSQADMALAVGGAFFTLLVVWFRRRLFHRNAQLNAFEENS